jgi:hypothetical protein
MISSSLIVDYSINSISNFGLPDYEFQIVYEKNKITLIKRTFDKKKAVIGAVQEEFWIVSMQKGVIGYETHYLDFNGGRRIWTRNNSGVWREQFFDKLGELTFEKNHGEELIYASMLNEKFYGFGIYTNSVFPLKTKLLNYNADHFVWNPGTLTYWDKYDYTFFE